MPRGQPHGAELYASLWARLPRRLPSRDRHLEVSPVSRRPDLKRINEARRAAVRNVLIDENRMAATVADAWVREWESEARGRGHELDAEYWTIGLAWIHSRRNEVGRDALGAQDTSASRCPMTTSASATPP
jgi:hypothetical protein